MAFAGIFQPFARLRWIRFGLLMRDRKFSRRFFRSANNGFTTTISSVGCSAFLAIRKAGPWPVITASQGPCGSHLGPKRTPRFVIFLSLAVFDRVKAEGLAASAEPDARNAPDLAPCPRLRLTRSEIAIHEFGRHRHQDQSKNPAHHTTGSKLAPRRAVLKFNFDAIHRSIMQTDGASPDDLSRCSRSSLTGNLTSVSSHLTVSPD
jgi:hypothetical protein